MSVRSALSVGHAGHDLTCADWGDATARSTVAGARIPSTAPTGDVSYTILAIGAGLVLVLEYLRGSATFNTSPAWPIVEALVAGAALLAVWPSRTELRLAPILILGGAFQLGWIAIHLHLGVHGDHDPNGLYSAQGEALLHGENPHSEYPPGAVALFALDTWLGGGTARTANAFLMIPFQLLCVAGIWALRTQWTPWLSGVRCALAFKCVLLGVPFRPRSDGSPGHRSPARTPRALAGERVCPGSGGDREMDPSLRMSRPRALAVAAEACPPSRAPAARLRRAGVGRKRPCFALGQERLARRLLDAERAHRHRGVVRVSAAAPLLERQSGPLVLPRSRCAYCREQRRDLAADRRRRRRARDGCACEDPRIRGRSRGARARGLPFDEPDLQPPVLRSRACCDRCGCGARRASKLRALDCRGGMRGGGDRRHRPLPVVPRSATGRDPAELDLHLGSIVPADDRRSRLVGPAGGSSDERGPAGAHAGSRQRAACLKTVPAFERNTTRQHLGSISCARSEFASSHPVCISSADDPNGTSSTRRSR